MAKSLQDLQVQARTVHVIDFVSLFCCSNAILKPNSPGNDMLFRTKYVNEQLETVSTVVAV